MRLSARHIEAGVMVTFTFGPMHTLALSVVRQCKGDVSYPWRRDAALRCASQERAVDTSSARAVRYVVLGPLKPGSGFA